ncbi:metal dependent phosphohydrolase [Alkaliphilus metalliredigens QYMF]|uniref:Metal dependent phosphohydrolase n=1 Tax=Alkaliphilus metalliredigens (strain QYMF) TaxID=293826 RepID=A6TLA9_ALKMQ|nr:HD domain-containing phosphohydrolase [Alkaliphilus metalliredigens]ABR46977.1 metal dependent phosphohydrolase [Alkaliphilus metalliredigens QYMF]
MQCKIKEKSISSIDSNIPKHNFSLEIFIHSVNVANISLKIATAIELVKVDKDKLYKAALFHDMGKSKIPQSILYKEDKLTNEEWQVMKKHALYSEMLFRNIVCENKGNKENIEIGKILRHHHENWDGSGYPDEKSGEDIHLYSRIIRIADIFDAITQSRVYRPFKIKDTMELMKRMKGKEIDPYIFDKSYDLLSNLLNEEYKKNTSNWS